MKTNMLVVSVLFLMLCTAGWAADWPNFHGPLFNGHSPETDINKNWAENPPAELWRIPMNDRGYAGPSVANGTVYIIDREGGDDGSDVVMALDLQTGEELWRFTYPDPGKFNYGYARSTPTVDEDRVYTLSRMGLLYCLDAATGEQIWHRNIRSDFGGTLPSWHYAFSPLIDGDRLIVIPGGPQAGTVALNKLTGETIWTGGLGETPSYATPYLATLAGIRQYIVFTVSHVTGVDTETGTLLWQFPWENRSKVNSAMPIVIGDSIFMTASYGFGCGMLDITADGPALRWENKDMMIHFNSPILVDNHIYGISDPAPGFLTCMNPEDGTVVWKQPEFEKGGLVAVDGVLIALDGKNGDVVMAVADPSGYTELGRISAPLGGQSWTAPIVADKKLLIRNLTGLACFDLQ